MSYYSVFVRFKDVCWMVKARATKDTIIRLNFTHFCLNYGVQRELQRKKSLLTFQNNNNTGITSTRIFCIKSIKERFQNNHRVGGKKWGRGFVLVLTLLCFFS
ncbi:unnamed protein product [Spodoptera littoralis]|uniref:Uncharacterized protein n=1 Tax=Spodoptera littoralis TaxID=7109 RepID=A0A9P0IKZ1_SPOLI|nr:unnamed protein product [Spodoptera littoralis]CAH1647674.1 unnamed protein product [Spodoptera littoralis]